MGTQIVNIHVFGRTLKLSCPEEEVDALKSAAKDLEERLTTLKNKSQLMNSDVLLITAALNLSFELSREQQKNMHLNSEFNEKIKSLQNLLDRGLNNFNQ